MHSNENQTVLSVLKSIKRILSSVIIRDFPAVPRLSPC